MPWLTVTDSIPTPNPPMDDWQQPGESPLAAYARRQIAARDHEVAYRAGAYIAARGTDGHPDPQARAIELAATYLGEGPTGAHRAALVLAGFTGAPREAA